MAKELTARIHVSIDGKDHLWESLPPDKQKEMGLAFNDRALRAIGYEPSKETIDKTA